MTRIIYEVGKLKVKMDTRDDTYFDAKDPHVYFERNGKNVLKHCYLSDVDNWLPRGIVRCRMPLSTCGRKSPN